MFTGCKLNLFLEITGQRQDGYHTLNTLFWPLSNPTDQLDIDFSAPPGITFHCDKFSENPEENLVFKAANIYAQRTGVSPTWRLELKKSVPIAAGLGGGSGDAAAVLKLLNNHYQKATACEIAEMALLLGADVPFFLNPKPALASGVGEILTILPPPLILPPIVLVFPEFPVSAKWAFQHQLQRTPGNLDLLLEGLHSGDPDIIGRELHNDLAPALYKKFPMLRLLKQQMLESGAAGVEITGSGSSLFAIAHNRQEREKIALSVSQRFSGVQIFQLNEMVIK